MKKELVSNDFSQIDSLLESIKYLVSTNGLDKFRYTLASKQRIIVDYYFFELEDDKEMEIIIQLEGKIECVNVMINIHYLLKMMNKMKLTLLQAIKILYAKYRLHALMGLYNLNKKFPNVKIRELAYNLEINWKLNKNDEYFFPRAFMFGLEEYKSWQYYYKSLELMMKDDEELNLSLDPTGSGKPTDESGEGNENANTEPDFQDENNSQPNEQIENKTNQNLKDKIAEQNDNLEEKTNNDSNSKSKQNNIYQLKLEKYLEKMNEIRDQVQDLSEPLGNFFEDNIEDLKEEIVKESTNLCDYELNEIKIKNFNVGGFHKLLQELLRKERQVRITQTRKTDSYHRINNRREEKGLILPGKKIVKHGVQKKFAEELDVFIDVSGSTQNYIRQADVHYIDLMNYIAQEFHNVGARVIFYNYYCNRIVRPNDLFVPARAFGTTDILNVVRELEGSAGSKLKRVIVFTDGYDNYNTLYDTHDDVQIYKLAPNPETGFEILKYNRDIDGFRYSVKH